MKITTDEMELKTMISNRVSITHRTVESLPASEPPPDAPAHVEWEASAGSLRLVYRGTVILDGRVEGQDVGVRSTVTQTRGVEQRVEISGRNLVVSAIATGSEQMIAAEMWGEAQQRFPMIRTCHGVSSNRRNNAVYDRQWDWALTVEGGQARMVPEARNGIPRAYAVRVGGDRIELVFRPRFYQKHRGIPFFEPWTYRVREDSITGWCSWYAYFTKCAQTDCNRLMDVWKKKRLLDFGYRWIQLDDGYEDEKGPGRARPCYPTGRLDYAYPSRGPDTWLNWREDLFPAGMSGYVESCRRAGFEAGIWVGAHFTDREIVERHPEWFVRDETGKPFAGPWVVCGVDTTCAEAVNHLIRPTFEGVCGAGFSYVKIDLLRHYLYDNLHRNPSYCRARGVSPAQMFRRYLAAAREALGPEALILACWGVLPEAVGMADACRIAGDGYGPASMQCYNSWNGIVWRNDPDACEIAPRQKPAETGNVTRFEAVTATESDAIIRPALASIAGAVLMLADPPEAYEDDRRIEGLKRSSPVLFSVPGQLYDYREEPSNTLLAQPRESIVSGTHAAPCDADQYGAVCPWWLNEFDIPGVGQWNVLHRVNWGTAAPAATVLLADIGLDPSEEYLVYEFWTQTFLGPLRERLDLPAAAAMELRSYALRRAENRPQIVSTNRHLSQGGVDLECVEWRNGALSGKSRVVAGDRYELAVYVPEGYEYESASCDGLAANGAWDGRLWRVSCCPARTGSLSWELRFRYDGSRMQR